MSSVGVFRKEEIDGKLFLVFTLTQIDNPTSSGDDALAMASAMASGGDDLPHQPLFFCPAARIKFHKLKLKIHDDDADDLHPFNSSPHFPNTRSSDQQGESLLDSDHPGVCKLPVVPLFWCNNKETSTVQFECGACKMTTLGNSYYACLQCQRNFHKECVESPLEIKHPSYPLCSLRLSNFQCMFTSGCCRKITFGMFYRCTTCELSMHPVCAMRPVPLVIDHPKSHPHPLSLFPTQASTVCNICARIKKLDPTYICIQCVFVIHKGCMGFPHVIRISRHPHRISFTSSLPSRMLSCRVCHQQVDNNYGAYSCNKCDAYFVHSTCALHRNVWDGKELEGVSEEDDNIDDGEPFERIADGIIHHPFHSHHLRIENSTTYDEIKYCQGCALPIYEGQFYSCMECDFILHEGCASAPRMKRYPLYPHPLTLKFATMRDHSYTGEFRCFECDRYGNGFFYEHRGEDRPFRIDLRCASIIEPFNYQGHEHPLFLPWNTEKKTRCEMCKYESNGSKLICIECDYYICFRCVTFPYKVRYKHDSHFLTSCNGKEASDQADWCDVCEGKIGEVKKRRYLGFRKKTELRFYKCDGCSTAVHVDFLLGVDMYMRPDKTMKDYISIVRLTSKGTKRKDLWILVNNSLTRPICSRCFCRCPFPIYFKGQTTIFCSLYCSED
ncbi:PREDICTED: uncharacterized protein LOC104755409 isoform X2 [Camelina sativa]|uniref:Uncharacterized protein LOC104755409 isoform X2 n=1 Tax=Camelina sativa TaxID=90675 RepID=A0ABM1QLY4_CAMSA|nr:PREDICTED: uncharacterized protein LOC104755409 isoform X2 [Camelina sativa]